MIFAGNLCNSKVVGT